MDHVSHFTALSQTYSILVQKGRAREREGAGEREREGDEGNKKDKGGEIGVGGEEGRGWWLQPSVQTRNEKEQMHRKECERGRKSVGGRRDNNCACVRRKRDKG